MLVNNYYDEARQLKPISQTGTEAERNWTLKLQTTQVYGMKLQIVSTDINDLVVIYRRFLKRGKCSISGL